MRTESIEKMMYADSDHIGIKELYNSLLRELSMGQLQFRETSMVAMPVLIGSQYSGDMMIVGRAVNDWQNYLSKGDPNSAEKAANEVVNELMAKDLAWVKERWGANDGKYNTKRSAFWRVAVNASSLMFQAEGWPVDRIAYSNLYKVAPDGGGNPSERLCDAQFLFALQILELEIAALRPKVVLCMTGWNWASPFFETFFEVQMGKNYNYVQRILRKDGTLVIVVPHPQGKREDLMVEEVLYAISENQG